MKRRDFIAKGTAGVLSAGLIGCSAAKTKKTTLWKELSHFYPRPDGTMPMNELGKTGIKISGLTFGSHIREEMVGFDIQRERVIREAYDMGVNTFDVYDGEQNCFQYEPMGRFLKPIINDVIISISMKTYEGRTMEQELERALKLFGRDYIDLVRCHAVSPHDQRWAEHWVFAEKLFRYKEKGLVRAVGAPIHDIKDLDVVFDTYPLDYVLFPYNFYHNICWLGDKEEDMNSLPAMLRRRGVGVVTMKPFAGDYLVTPFIKIGRKITSEPQITFPRAALRYVLNSGIDTESIFCGMYSLEHLYEDIVPFYKTEMSDEEKALLNNIRNVATQQASAWLPEHYKWLENWAHTTDGNQISKRT